MNAELKVGYSDYHDWYVQIIKGGVIANGFKTKENAEKWAEKQENKEFIEKKLSYF